MCRDPRPVKVGLLPYMVGSVRYDVRSWRPAMDETSALANHRYNRLTNALEWPMALLALAVIPALLLDNGSATPMTHLVATAVNWFVWVAFCAEFALRLRVAPDRTTFVKRSWFDLLIIAIS